MGTARPERIISRRNPLPALDAARIFFKRDDPYTLGDEEGPLGAIVLFDPKRFGPDFLIRILASPDISALFDGTEGDTCRIVLG